MDSHLKNPHIHWAIVLMGFTSIVAQVLLMRELVAIFYGNELSLGTMLGVWLFWTAAGSGFVARILKKTHRPHLRIGLIQLTISFILPLVLMLVRSSKNILGITLGEMIGFLPMFLITVITLAPFCLLSGLLYTVACQLVHGYEGRASFSIGKVYLLEAVGSGMGGLISSIVFVRFMSTAHIFLLLSLLNLISAILLGNLNPFRYRRLRKVWLPLILFLYVFVALRIWYPFQHFCDRILWRGFNLVTTQNTVFGNLAVTRMGDQISFFQNGILVFTAPDRLTAEESVHYSLLEHPRPKKVLLIGGGLGGGIQETLHHPSVKEVAYVELDPTLVLLAEKYLLPEQVQPYRDARVNLYHIDGRRFIIKSSDKFDVIILNLPNPYTALINRFYTQEFFQEVNQRLNTGGIFSLQVTSSENAIGPELSDFLSNLSTTLRSVFSDMVIIPGETNRFIVSNRSGVLTPDPQILVQRLKARNLPTLYVREYYFPYQMTEERQAYLESKIHSVPSEKINRDFKPIGYFYDTILWATTYSSVFKKLFLAFARLRSIHVAGFFALTAFLLVSIKWRPRRKTNLFSPAILYSILGVGFTEISLEVILILGFQILYGHVYQQLAIIIAGYMAGLAWGSRLAISKKIHPQRIFPLFRFFQLLMFLYPLLIAGLLWIFHWVSISGIHYDWVGWFFPLLILGAGFIGGYQFPLANRLYLRTGKSVERVAGFLYGIDLLGSSAGAFLTSAFFIPIMGIFPTLLLMAALNLCGLFVLMMSKEISATKSP
jgi:spermidine synthase